MSLLSRKLPVLAGFFKKEFAQVLRDPVMRAFLLVAPVFQLTIFGYAISNEFKNIRLAAVFAPTDIVARQLSDRFYASRWFVRPERSAATPDDYLRSGKADAVLIMPTGGLTKAMGRGTARVQLLIDAQNATKARSVEAYVTAVVRQFIAEKLPSGVPVPPVVFDVRILFNPTMETAYFMVPGVMTMLICLVTVLMTGISIAREKELGTFETIIAAPVSNTQIILGKTVPYAVLGLVDATLIITAGVLIFGVPVRGSLLLMAAASIVYVCTTVCVGTLISTFARNQQQAMMGSFLFIFPAFLLSGILFPIENMPFVIRFFAYCDPLTYFVRVLRNIMLKGANPQLVWTNIGILVVIAFVTLEITIRRLRQTLD
jgi:ABC-2 type transport system permease protein